MKFGVGSLFVVVGLLVLWLAVTGRLANLDGAWRVLTGQKPEAATDRPISGPARRDPLGVLSEALNIESGADFSVLPTLGLANASSPYVT